MPARVSIIIPCYNQARYVREAAGSALAQNDGPLELVLVDDGSTDETAQALDEIKASDPERIAIVSQENKGLSMARQAGLDRAAGELIVFLDSDDRLLPGMLAACVAAFDRSPGASAVVGRTRVVYENGRTAPKILNPGLNAVWPEILAANPFGSPCSMLLKKKDVVAAGGVGMPGVRACEDWDLYARMIRRGMRFERIDEVLAVYVQHEGVLSRDIALMLREKIALLDRMLSDAAAPQPLAKEDYARYRNGHVLFTLGEAAGLGLEAENIASIAENMVGGRVAFRYFCNQFLYGLQHSVSMNNARLAPEYIDEVCARLQDRFTALGFGKHAVMLAAEFRREMKSPKKRISIARRISRLIDPLR